MAISDFLMIPLDCMCLWILQKIYLVEIFSYFNIPLYNGKQNDNLPLHINEIIVLKEICVIHTYTILRMFANINVNRRKRLNK